jgi:hypothetical protein
MSDRHVLNAILTTVKRWEDDPAYKDSQAMLDVARIIDERSHQSQDDG